MDASRPGAKISAGNSQRIAPLQKPQKMPDNGQFEVVNGSASVNPTYRFRAISRSVPGRSLRIIVCVTYGFACCIAA